MRLTVLGSGSDGNGYLLEIESQILILECGVPLKEAKVALDFDLSRIVGCFVSHEHGDHAKYRKDYECLGVDFLAPYDTDKTRINVWFGDFHLQAFRLPHGDICSWGALIRHRNGETVLFATDYEYNPFIFRACKVEHYLVECNYQPQYVDLLAPNKYHKLMGHSSLPTCKRFLKENVTPCMSNVLLLHLGKGSASPQECIEEVKKVLPNDVHVDYARANTIYEFKRKGENL